MITLLEGKANKKQMEDVLTRDLVQNMNSRDTIHQKSMLLQKMQCDGKLEEIDKQIDELLDSKVYWLGVKNY